jgi:diacylglycerol O-acyltransferase / wax synthase
MTQEHGDRLTAVDASFLAQEGPAAHMHVGAVMIFDGPPPAYDELADHVRSRLHLVPRFRQKLAFPPLETGRPLWVDDPSFNLEYHVRDTALPSPGSEAQLRALAARVHSQALDRTKPLWEMWLVEGLEGGRFALLSKTHHALVDGVSGVDLATVLFDLQREPVALEHPPEPWQPRPTPSGTDMVARGVRTLVGLPFDVAGRAAGAAMRPGSAIAGTREALEGLGEVVWAGLNPAPETPINVEIGPHRRLVWVRHELSDFKAVKDAFGGTVNDVVLAVVAGALQKWLRSRGVRTEGVELRALVPVSIRARDEHHQLGNRLAAMRAPLPIYVEDPVARLRVVRQAMDGLKESKQAVGAEVLAGMQALAPPTILAQASRLNFSTRLFNLLVTNVPGPQFPLYVLGRRLRDLFPVAFLPKRHALAVAVMSYDGGMDFGLLGDYDAMPDLELLGSHLGESLAELLGAVAALDGAGKANGKRPRVSSRARTSRPRTSSPASTEA